MHVTVSGILVNESGELLVIKRNDTRTWAAPGGHVNGGELLIDALTREFEEETGFKVLPVRLVGVWFIPRLVPDGHLTFVFRCLLRGGVAKTSLESLEVGYTPTNPLGVPMLKLHRTPIARALRHAGGAPEMQIYRLSKAERLARFVLFNVVYSYFDFKRRLTSQPFEPGRQWQIASRVVARNEAGAVLWLRPKGETAWRLPGGPAKAEVAPWVNARRTLRRQSGLLVDFDDLAAIYTCPDDAELSFLFRATVEGGQPLADADTDLCFAPVDEPPGTALAEDVQRVADAVDPRREETIFKYN